MAEQEQRRQRNNQDRRVRRTKRNIRSAFVQLIQEKNLDTISVTELARKADVDRKTFYAHYATVVDVYKDLLKEVTRELEDMLSVPGPIDFFDLFGKLTRIMEHDIGFYRAIARRNSYAYLVDECSGILARKLAERVRARHGSLDLAAKVRVSYAASGIIGVYIEWLRNDADLNGTEDPKDLNEIVTELADITEAMLGAL